MMIQLESWYRVTESYSGENVGHRPGERAAVLPRATIGITEIAIRFQNEITLAATITPRPRTMRDDRRPPTLRNCTELSTAPRVSARAFPVDANLRDLARLHAGHGAILRFNQSLGYGKLSDRLIDGQSGTVMQPSTQPPLPIVIFADERRAMELPAVCTSTP